MNDNDNDNGELNKRKLINMVLLFVFIMVGVYLFLNKSITNERMITLNDTIDVMSPKGKSNKLVYTVCFDNDDKPTALEQLISVKDDYNKRNRLLKNLVISNKDRIIFRDSIFWTDGKGNPIKNYYDYNFIILLDDNLTKLDIIYDSHMPAYEVGVNINDVDGFVTWCDNYKPSAKTHEQDLDIIIHKILKEKIF